MTKLIRIEVAGANVAINPELITSLNQVGNDVKIWMADGNQYNVRDNTIAKFAEFLRTEKGIVVGS